MSEFDLFMSSFAAGGDKAALPKDKPSSKAGTRTR